MFNWLFRKQNNPDMRVIAFEDLEDRRLLSGGHVHHAVRYATSSAAAVHSTTKAGRYSTRARTAATTTTTTASETTIQFSAAPAAVQSGLAALVPASVTIAATQNVEVNTDSAGVVTYTAFIRATGFVGTIGVDATGAPITVNDERGGCGGDHGGDHGDGESNATTVQFSAVPAVVATQLQSQVDAGVTIPATQTVRTFTNDSGTVIYEAVVNNDGVLKEIASDASGNAVTTDDDEDEHKDQTIIKFSAAPAAVQTGLQGLAPTGVTIADTQNISVRTDRNGEVTYSTLVTNSAGATTSITVDANGQTPTTGYAGRGEWFGRHR